MAAIKSLSQKHPLGFGNEQLPSPISASIPSTPSQTSTFTSTSTAPTSLLSGNASDQILPIKSFVHEVLRRSRTSGIVLQTALCYLEAIRTKVPNLLREERMGIRAYYQPESRILPATEAELAQDAKLNVLENSIESEGIDDGMDTIRIADCVDNFDSETKTLHEEFGSSTSASLPSPLLCPRRTFLASVILASKFSQDKCYSNRAWAKLSGLPPREIGRCERALGQALEWRLWVGKTLLSSQTPTGGSTPPLRQVARSQSEGSVLIHSSTQSQFLNQENIPGSVAMPMSDSHRRCLRKSATLPADAFVSRRRIAPFVESTCNYGDSQEANDTPQLESNSQVATLIYSQFFYVAHPDYILFSLRSYPINCPPRSTRPSPSLKVRVPRLLAWHIPPRRLTVHLRLVQFKWLCLRITSSPTAAFHNPGLIPMILRVANPTLSCHHWLQVAIAEMARLGSFLWLILRLSLLRHINVMVCGTKEITV